MAVGGTYRLRPHSIGHASPRGNAEFTKSASLDAAVGRGRVARKRAAEAGSTNRRPLGPKRLENRLKTEAFRLTRKAWTQAFYLPVRTATGLTTRRRSNVHEVHYPIRTSD